MEFTLEKILHLQRMKNVSQISAINWEIYISFVYHIKKRHNIALQKITFAIVDKENKTLELDGLYMQFLDLSKIVESLKHLEVISLRNNSYYNFPSFISRLKKLERISLSFNYIQTFPEEVKHLKRLRLLDLSENKISKLPDDILDYELIKKEDDAKIKMPKPKSKDENYEIIYEETKRKLSKILNIPIFENPRINLDNLVSEYLNLVRTNIVGRTSKIYYHKGQIENRSFDYPSMTYSLRLHGNLFSIPVEIYKRRPSELVRYILDLQNARETKALHEAKLIFLGSGFVGKTSLIKMITGEGFNPKEEKTDGIKITELKLEKADNSIKLNIWDFGGQEIMHATHKFFLTKRSIYVLVINPRTEDKYGDSELEYWLKMIISFAGFVPIIIAINKCETHPIDIGKGALKDKYPSIVGFVNTSCKENIGIEKLKSQIQEALFKVKHIDEKLPISYFNIKDELEKINNDYLQYSAYEKICLNIDPMMTQESRKILVNLLHDLGIMLNFSENRLLENTQVLNPEWVTQGVYSIITSYLIIEQKGVITVEDTYKILDPKKYPTIKERQYILDIMQYFELAYNFDFRDKRYFIPGAFPKDKPDFEWNYSSQDKITFIFEYDVLPKSIVSRFLVKIFRLIRGADYWRNGVVIEYHMCQSLIYADLEEKRIKIEIIGSGERRNLLSIIREKLEQIHSSFNGLEINQFIEFVDDELETIIKINYDDLIIYYEEKKDKIFITDTRREYNVGDLLFGVDNRYKSDKSDGIFNFYKAQKLKELISKSRTNDFFEECLNTSGVKESPFYNELIMLYSRFNKAMLEKRHHIISNSESSIEFSKINKGIIELIDEMTRK